MAVNDLMNFSQRGNRQMNKQNVKDKVADLWRSILWSMDNSDECYSDADKRYLSQSIALVIVFFDEANTRRYKGVNHSAKKIIEDLRAKSAVGDCSDRFKICNTGTALLAHVYNDVTKTKYFDVKTRHPFGELKEVAR